MRLISRAMEATPGLFFDFRFAMARSVHERQRNNDYVRPVRGRVLFFQLRSALHRVDVESGFMKALRRRRALMNPALVPGEANSFLSLTGR